jgi:ParB family chromosome partitioning protein
VAHRGLSVRETERLVQHLLNPPAKRAAPRVSRDVQRLQEELSDLLGAVVKLASGAKGRGKLTIEYSNLDQLEGILNKLRNQKNGAAHNKFD